VDLPTRSVEVILAGQSASGAYVASPSFEVYRYSWLRDGCFVADAMREIGEVESADRFFDWCARIVLARPTGPWDARYTLEGERDPSDWPKLQTDGLGLLLWALRRRGTTRWEEAAALVRSWLGLHWSEPSVDWWEEREGSHAATLWCIGEGLDSDEIRREAVARAADRVDASQLFIGTPELVERVESTLVSPGGGVWRNLDDEYYGGGEWPLLTALLGLARPARAAEALAWIEAHAAPNGDLPEQVQDHLLRPERYLPWVEKWGQPACPLLWSHAMYLRLHHAHRNRAVGHRALRDRR
jgi:GH15 family glucan-1,4-alpha-glucosidase